MTHKPPKLRTKAEKAAAEERRRNAPPLTLGDVLGAEIKADRAAKERRAELDAMGFKPLNSA